MANTVCSNGVIVYVNRVQIDGKKLPPCPTKGKNITILNRKVYIDGYEFKNGKWKRTFRALWHLWF